MMRFNRGNHMVRQSKEEWDAFWVVEDRHIREGLRRQVIRRLSKRCSPRDGVQLSFLEEEEG